MTDHADLVLCYFLDQIKMTCFAEISSFLEYMRIIWWTLSANSDYKTQITVKKSSNLRMFFPLTDIVSNINYPSFWLFKQSCWDHPPTFYTTVLPKRVERKFWVWLFYKNMKDGFTEGLPYITHFVVYHPFLRRPQILLTCIKRLALMKSDLIKEKQKLHFPFE